ncbi:MAG: ATP-NAD kinase family protein [Desulfobacter sp.]|nr:MAG: ATP-NAD kinase family protein [Desulfobacter sp.]
MIRIGLIINPIAGMGGRVGLKGTDGLAEKAKALGGSALAPEKTARALAGLAGIKGVCILTPPGKMGEDAANGAGLDTRVLDMPLQETTTGEDTRAAAALLLDKKIDLLLFAGGDGTARDICSAVGEALPVLGIPAGVKIHSPVFSRTPEAAGFLVRDFIQGGLKDFRLGEVLDIAEASYRQGRVKTKLYGYLKVPLAGRVQARKSGTPMGEAGAQNLIGLDFIDAMEKDTIYIIGPGTTTRPVMTNLHLDHTLLGVDLVQNRSLLVKDASEKEIFNIIKDAKIKIFITPIGGQGYLFGRGNHQISPRIIRQAGKENICVGATLQKIALLRGQPFFVDTGDLSTDQMLAGYIRVITGVRQEMIYPVA